MSSEIPTPMTDAEDRRFNAATRGVPVVPTEFAKRLEELVVLEKMECFLKDLEIVRLNGLLTGRCHE